MARKLNLRNTEAARQKIRTTVLLKRLDDHVHGKLELTQSQAQTAQFLVQMAMSKPVQQVEQTGTLQITWAK